MLARDLILNHFWLKLFSLVLAALIWLAIRANLSSEAPPAKAMQTEAVREFPQCPVLLMAFAADRRPFKVEPSQVSVTIRGPVARVAQLQDHELHAYVQWQPGRSPAGLWAVEVHAPHGLEVIHVQPRAVNIKLSE